jgi:cytoskeleton protein RodZ
MSGDEKNSDEVKERAAPVAGQRLAVARRDRRLEIAAVAAELHIDADKVRALEENRFDELGASVYTKGYLRRYASFIGVPTDDVFAEYYELTRTDGVPPVVILRKRQPRDWSLGPWIIGVVALAVLGALAYWWFSGAFDGDATSEDSQPRAIASATDTVTLPPATATQESLSAPPGTEDVPEYDDADELLGELPAEPVSQDISVALYYRGDCWTEVADATGRRLYYDLGKAGRTVDVTGVGPITVLLGDSSQVDVEVDGRSFQIPPGSIEGSLARFQVSKQ